MENLNRKIMACFLILFAGLFMFFSAAPSALALESRTVTVGTGSGNWGDTVSIPVSVDNPAGIGGVAFTLNFDPAVLEFDSISKAVNTISNGDEYKETDGSYVVEESEKATVGSTLFLQSNADNTNGKVLVAAASASALTDAKFFNVKFNIKSNSGTGTYTVGIAKSIITNAAAGYATPTAIPALVGLPTGDPEVYPQYNTTLNNGKITVSAASTSYRTIGGAVTYEGGTAAKEGTPVTLYKKSGTSYILDETGTVKSGAYSFSQKLAGDYKISVTSMDPNFYSTSDVVTVADDDVTKNIVLPAPVRVAGTITLNNGDVVPGMNVKVTDNSGNLIGMFAVNSDGTFSSGPLAPGTYKTYVVYGNLEQLFEGTSYNWVTTLYKISGTISGLDTGNVTITAGSDTGKVNSTVIVNLDTATTYEIVNLAPANDYMVSATVENKPVQYFNSKTDITQADSVDISNADNTAVDFDFTTTTMATISGTVTEGDTGLGEVMVFAMNVDTYGTQSDTTDANGNYSLAVIPGTYEVFAILDDGSTYYYSSNGGTTNNLNLTNVTVTDGQDLDIDITIPVKCEETLTGVVTFDGGEPVPFALIVAVSANNTAVAVTGLDGAYTLKGLCTGDEYTVQMDPVSGNYGIQTETITAGTDTDLTFVIDTGNTLTGTVKDSVSDSVIPNAMIYLIDQENETIVGGRMYYSNDSGVYTINDIPDGVYTIIVSHPEYKTDEAENVEILIDVTRDINLLKGASFKGTVLDGSNSNAALSGALIIATGNDVVPVYAVTGRNGAYEIPGLDASTSYMVLAQKKGYVRQIKPNETPIADGKVVDFTLAKPLALFNLSGTVTSDCSGTPAVAGAVVVVSSVEKDFFAVATTNNAGTYSFKDLPQATDYRYLVIPGGDLMYVELVNQNTTSAGDLTWSPVIPCGSTITGTVTYSGSSTAYVFLYTSDSEFVGYTTVASSGGTFTFNGVSGDYKVFVTAAGNTGEWYNNGALVTAGSPAINVNLTD